MMSNHAREKFEPRKKKDLEVTFHNSGLVAYAEAGSPVNNPTTP